MIRFNLKTEIFPSGYFPQEESIIERIEKQELEAKIQEGIGSLESQQREVLVLRDIQGFSYEEIGQTLKLPQGRSDHGSSGPESH